MDTIYVELMKLFPTMNTALASGIFVFARLMGFFRLAPVFNKKEIPGMVKICLALLFTFIVTPFLKPETMAGTQDSFVLSILLNFVVGAIIGYIAQLILLAIDAGADMINMQMGLSSAMVLDPTTSRSFEIFPLFATHLPWKDIVNMDYLIKMSSNVLFIGLQIASPVLLATLGQDIILGVISKTAPQVNVFQLSFLFKPVFGAAIMVWILPMLLNVISDYFLTYAKIF